MQKVYLLTNVGAAEDGNENKNYVRKIKAKVIDITELTCYNGAKKPAGKKYTFCQPVFCMKNPPNQAGSGDSVKISR